MNKAEKEGVKKKLLSGDVNSIKSAIRVYLTLDKCDVPEAARRLRKLAREENREDLIPLIDEAGSAMNKQGCTMAIIFAIVAIAMGAWIFSKCDGASSSLDTTKVENSAIDGSVWQVKKALKRVLKDPDSYESVSWGQVHSDGNGGYTVTHTYRAKNSFGGYEESTVTATLDSQGNVVGLY